MKLSGGNGIGGHHHAVGQSGLAVVDVGDDG